MQNREGGKERRGGMRGGGGKGSSPGVGNDVSSLEANHVVVAHQRGMTVVPLTGFQDALKLRVVIGMPAPCGAMLLMEVVKSLYLRQQPTALLHPNMMIDALGVHAAPGSDNS